MGLLLAEDARKIELTAESRSDIAVDFRTVETSIPFEAPIPLEIFETEYKKIMEGDYLPVLKDWAEQYLDFLKSGQNRRQMHKTIVQAARIGHVGLAFIPGEMFNASGIKIKRALKNRNVMVAGFSNDLSVGYLPSEDEYEKGGGEVDSEWKYYGLLRPSPECERIIVDTAVRLLQEMFGET